MRAWAAWRMVRTAPLRAEVAHRPALRFHGSVFGNLRWSRCGKGHEARRLYKAQLCSSCHAMREFSGRTTSLLANYDQSLLVLVLSAVAGGAVEQRRCTGVPWRTVAVQDLPTSLRSYVAAGNLALIDAKLRDDVDDGSRWYAGIVRLILRRKTRKAIRELAGCGFPVELMTGLPERQRTVEQTTQPSLASLAEPSAELLAAVFAHGGRLVEAEAQTSQLSRFGHAVARAVYGFDALDDHDEDRASDSFNAVVSLATCVGHITAVEAVRQFVDHAAVEAQQCATQLLPADRHSMVASILQQLTTRAGECRDHLLGRPALAAMRPAEAGDCDCACDACSGCDACDCSCHNSPSSCHGANCCCEGCCDPCFFWDSGRAQKRADRKRAKKSDVSGMPMQD